MTKLKLQRLPMKNTVSGNALKLLLDNPEGVFILESENSWQLEDHIISLSTYFHLPVIFEFIGIENKRYYLGWDLLDYEIKERIGGFKACNYSGVKNG